MKKTLLIITLFCSILLPVMSADTAKPRLAVVQFSINDAQNNKLVSDTVAVRNMVQSNIVKSGQYDVIARDEIDKILENQEIQASSISSSENLRKLKLMNISYLVTGSVDAIDNYYQVSISILDVANGRFVYSDDEFMENSAPEVNKGIKTLVSRFIDSLGSNAEEIVIVDRTNNQQQIPNTVTDGFVFVEAGEFLLGKLYDENLPYNVVLSSFYISNHEVTQSEYFSVMGKNPSAYVGNDLPVTDVDWYDAIEYCNKLSVKEGLEPCYSLYGKTDTAAWGLKNSSWNLITCNFKANGYRLPTEAEWEFVSTGGTKSEGTYLYSGSNDLNSVAWYADNSDGIIHSVMTKMPNELGVYDMSGNVYEWCWDWTQDYSNYNTKEIRQDPTGPTFGERRICRGGCCTGEGSDYSFCSIWRQSAPPENAFTDVGFRVARSASGRTSPNINYSIDVISFYDDIVIDETTYRKTDAIKVQGVIINGNGSSGAFPSGRTVALNSFIIGRYLVTQGLYKAVTSKIPDFKYTSPSKGASDTLIAGEKQELRPVESVDYIEIAKFCNKLSELQGLEPVFTINGDTVTFDISKNGWRLPTEAEWECAARGGNPNDITNWNNVYGGASNETDLLNYAWVKANSNNVTHEVGLKKPNALEIYDIIGNVYEWCLDLSGDIKTGTVINPTGAATGTMRVQRSSSKGSNSSITATTRDEGEQTKWWTDVGFRLCRSAW